MSGAKPRNVGLVDDRGRELPSMTAGDIGRRSGQLTNDEFWAELAREYDKTGECINETDRKIKPKAEPATHGLRD